MNSSKNISPWQFTIFRVVLGFYLAWHFAELIPYGTELFSHAGVLPQASSNLTYRAFPNILGVADSPAQVHAFLALLVGLSISFLLGWHRRFCAIALWYGWACLFNRNNLISNLNSSLHLRPELAGAIADQTRKIRLFREFVFSTTRKIAKS